MKHLIMAVVMATVMVAPCYAVPMAYNYTTETWYTVGPDEAGIYILTDIRACSKTDTWGIGSDTALIPDNGETEGIEMFEAAINVMYAISSDTTETTCSESTSGWQIYFQEWNHPRANWKCVHKYQYGHKIVTRKTYLEVEE